MSNRKTPIHFTVDFAGKQIIGTQASLNKAKHYDSKEYHELCKLVAAHPQFEIVCKDVSKNKSKKTYKHLDFHFIETYISIQLNAAELIKEYEEVKQIAATLGLSAYPRTKSWFLKKFSAENRPFDMDKAIEEMEKAGLAAAQADVVA